MNSTHAELLRGLLPMEVECRNEQVCQGVQCKTLLNGPTDWIHALYKNLPLSFYKEISKHK